MTGRGAIGLLASGMAMLALSACGKPPAEVRTRITVQIDTPSGVRSGWSVWSFRLGEPALALASTYSPRFRGEAVAIDLAPGKTVFALVKDMEMVAERHFADLGPTGLASDRLANIRAIAKKVGATRQLSCTPVPEGLTVVQRSDPKYDCPLLVTFRDLSDPTSVVRVDPQNMAATLGPGVKMRAIIVAVTDEPVSVGIEKRLGWLDHLDRYRTDPTNPFTSTLPNEIGELRSK